MSTMSTAAGSSASAVPRARRPPFPAGWGALPLAPADLSLVNTLPVGQSFLWHRHAVGSGVDLAGDQKDSDRPADAAPTEEYARAVWPGRVVLLRQSPTHIYYTSVLPAPDSPDEALAGDAAQVEANAWARAWIDDYFQLARHPDLGALYADWRARDPGLFGRTELDARAVGVRVLRQDPWECLVAFVTSTNNHIPRITSLMHKLALHFSPPLLALPHPSTGEDVVHHLFPRPHELPAALETTLRALGFGYRAGFIESSLATLREAYGADAGDVERALEGWRGMPADEVRDLLVALKGVGRKVADCVMLMSLDQPALIPVDTHVSAIAARHPAFPSRLRNKPMSAAVYAEVQAFLADAWGPMGGWCQAVMFAADLPPLKPAGAPGTPGTPGTPGATPKKRARNAQSPATPGTPVAPLTPTTLDSKGADYLAGGPAASPSPGQKRAGDLPAAAGFKRTRSATRVALVRAASGVTARLSTEQDVFVTDVKEEAK